MENLEPAFFENIFMLDEKKQGVSGGHFQDSREPRGMTSREEQDSEEFRENSVDRITNALQSTLRVLQTLIKTGDVQQLMVVICGLDDLLNRKILDIDKDINIYSSEETIINFMVDVVAWKKPLQVEDIYNEVSAALVDKVVENSDWGRFAKGFYLMEILLHKYENGNGRTARVIKLLCDKIGDQDSTIQEKECRAVLGLDQEVITQLSETTFRINIHPDYENLAKGVAYFGMHKGFSFSEVTQELRLNSIVPEKAIEVLSDRLHVSVDALKKEFIHFMALETDLSFCTFPI